MPESHAGITTKLDPARAGPPPPRDLSFLGYPTAAAVLLAIGLLALTLRWCG